MANTASRIHSYQVTLGGICTFLKRWSDDNGVRTCVLLGRAFGHPRPLPVVAGLHRDQVRPSRC